jgi:phosphoserine phosphatase
MIVPKHLLEDIGHLQERFESMPANDYHKIAVFDLDNTLIEGDIGDAVYASLLKDSMVPAHTWEEYMLLAEKDPQKAYEEAAMALEGLSIQHVITRTRKIMQSEDSYITFSGVQVPIPMPNPAMKELVRILRAVGFIIYVISASNDTSAKVAASEWFNIPVGNVFGIRSAVHREKITRNLLTPLPVGEGKVSLYRKNVSGEMPLIVATDSKMDLPLLQMCDPYGIAILAGNDEQFYHQARALLPLSTRLHVIPSSRSLEQDFQRKAAG